MNSFEPYILEFVDDKQTIDFEFNSIIKRINQNYIEQQTFLIGSGSTVSMNDEFYLAGKFLLNQPIQKITLFPEFDGIQKKEETIYIHSKRQLSN